VRYRIYTVIGQYDLYVQYQWLPLDRESRPALYISVTYRGIVICIVVCFLGLLFCSLLFLFFKLVFANGNQLLSSDICTVESLVNSLPNITVYAPCEMMKYSPCEKDEMFSLKKEEVLDPFLRKQ
jgi:hypothetical protein